jgi:hypothetical protein
MWRLRKRWIGNWQVPLRICRDCLRTFAAAMLCARNMSALIPPVAPPSNAAERFRPSHHTLGRETLAANFSPRTGEGIWNYRCTQIITDEINAVLRFQWG